MMTSEDEQKSETSRQENVVSDGGELTCPANSAREPTDPVNSSRESAELIGSAETPEHPARKRQLNKLFKQGLRYVIVGFSSFALEFLLFVVLHELIAINVVVSNVIAITGASIYNFIMSRSWTFKSTSSLLRSITLYILLFIWNQIFSSWTILFLIGMDFSAMIAKIITMAIIVCWNFVLYRKVVFK